MTPYGSVASHAQKPALIPNAFMIDISVCLNVIAASLSPMALALKEGNDSLGTTKTVSSFYPYQQQRGTGKS